MTRVFISHSSSDKEFARRLSTELKSRGVEVWLDEWQIRVGDDIRVKIEQGISTYDYFAIILSKASVASQWVQRELSAAFMREMDANKVVILPIKLEHVAVPPLIAAKRYASFTDDFDRGLQDLLLVLKSISIADFDFKLGRRMCNARRGDPDKPKRIVTTTLATESWLLHAMIEGVGQLEAATHNASAAGQNIQMMIAKVVEHDPNAITAEMLGYWFKLADISVKAIRKENEDPSYDRVGLKMAMVMVENGKAHTASIGACSAFAGWQIDGKVAYSRLVTKSGFALDVSLGKEEALDSPGSVMAVAPLGFLGVSPKLPEGFPGLEKLNEFGLAIKPEVTPFESEGDFVTLVSHSLPTEPDDFEKIGQTVNGLDSHQEIARYFCDIREPDLADSMASHLTLVQELDSDK